MQFVKADQLKVGMRLARPIYNKKGVLLYERNSKLSSQGVHSIRNFGLIGIYILEPAEPVPPMTADDLAFERFQTMMVFAIKEELETILETEKTDKMPTIVNYIISNYGRMDHKINFIQNLRSKEDQIFKHSLNVAILCAMISNAMGISKEKQLEVVLAAVLHDIGKLNAFKEVGHKQLYSDAEKTQIKKHELLGYNLIDKAVEDNSEIRAICAQAFKAKEDYELGQRCKLNLKTGARILFVADVFDDLTAMRFNRNPDSEISVIKKFLHDSATFDRKAVGGLVKSINILVPGVSVELSNGMKAIVIEENKEDILRPMLLDFKDNKIIDLNNRRANPRLDIKDIMKTLDNRYIFDVETLRKYGFHVKEPEFVDIYDNEDVDEDVAEYVPGRDC